MNNLNNPKKYIAIVEGKKNPSDWYVREFDSLKNANFYAERLWDTMSYTEKKKYNVFCGWTSLDDNDSSVDFDDECFNSSRMFAIDVYIERERVCIGHGENIDASYYSFDVDMFAYKAARDMGEISEYVPRVEDYEGEGIVVGISSYIPSGLGSICSEKTFYKIDFQNNKYEVTDFKPKEDNIIKSVMSDTLIGSGTQDDIDNVVDEEMEM